MCLRLSATQPVPQMTALVALAAFPKGNAYMQIRDELGIIYQDEDFSDLYPDDGQPAIPPWRLALVTVMQFIENLTDRQAADAVRSRIDWKYALGLELTDAGFDFSVLSEFRARLVTGGAEQRLLDQMLQHFKGCGLLKAGGRQRTDSTHILSWARRLTSLECVGETMRQALNSLAIIAPEWLKPQIQSDWPERYNRPFGEYPVPKAEREIVELAETIGRDGAQLLMSILSGDQQWLLHVPTVQILHQVWAQNFYHEDGHIRWRRKGSKLPSAVQIRTPHDPEARFSHKRMTEWEGYKVHLTETCNRDAPLLITHVETTEATLQDVSVVDKIHDDLARLELLPDEHVVDVAYVSSDVLITSEQMGVDLIGPVRSDNSWQAHDPQAFDSSRFRIDWEVKAATCPQGMTSHSWVQCTDWRNKPAIHAVFRTSDCQACPVRERCTKSRYRTLTLQQQDEYLALQRARERQQTNDFRERYKVRAGVEGTISQAMYARKMRRSRYRGLAKTHLQHVAMAAGINLTRAVD